MDFGVQQKGCIVQMVCHGMTQPEMMRTRTTDSQEIEKAGERAREGSEKCQIATASLIILTRAELKIVFIEK